MIKEYKWIIIKKKGNSKSGKTQIYEVVNKDQPDFPIGIIKWNGGWRKYAFYPEPDSYYEEDCLINLADFLTELKIQKKKNETN
jgi:hypothetical protein